MKKCAWCDKKIDKGIELVGGAVICRECDSDVDKQIALDDAAQRAERIQQPWADFE